MPSRKKGREVALQLLYQADWEEDLDWDKGYNFAQKALEDYRKEFQPYERGLNDGELSNFILDIVAGVLLRRKEIDEVIQKFSKGWKIYRMAMVDRNILRLGIFELCYHPDIPPKVAINEAVELAKKFGDKNSPRFINGILDSVYRNWCREKRVSAIEGKDRA